MQSMLRLGLFRFTKLKPRKSNPSVNRVTRVLARLRINSILWALASNAAQAAGALCGIPAWHPWRREAALTRAFPDTYDGATGDP